MSAGVLPLAVFVLLAASSAVSAPAPPSTITVVVKDGQDIRSLAREYLNDPDMWQEILRANGLASAAAVRPGMALKIPATEVSRAVAELARAGEAIDKATKAGAQIFAPDAVVKAVEQRDLALTQRRAGAWSACLSLAESARREAEAALGQSDKKRHVVAEAVLVERTGTVQARRPADLSWMPAALGAKLGEGQKIRTLEDSLAEVRFQDGGRLRLGENSQAVIQRMRADLYEKRQEQSVILIEGDAQALLEPGGRQRTNFDLQAGAAKTQVRSTKFWVKKEAGATRFANYEGELEIHSGGAAIVLKPNQGATVSADAKVTAPRDLLPAPALSAPVGEATTSVRVAFAWAPVADARSYWLEISADPAFKKVLRERKDLREPHATEAGLGEGLYFWRVAAVDAEAFPGPKSEERSFRVAIDTTPPYLALTAPRDNARVAETRVAVAGEAEPGATLRLGEEPLTAGTDGKFQTELSLKPGTHTITLTATDAAGNVSTVRRKIRVAVEVRLEIQYDAAVRSIAPHHFVVPDAAFTLAGQTEPETALILRDAAGVERARTFADDAGAFRLAVVLSGEREDLVVAASLPGAPALEDALVVELDREPPQITLAPEPLAVTAEPEVRIEGRVAGATALTIGGAPVALSGESFSAAVALKPGPNVVRLVATDGVGNTSSLLRTVALDQEPPALVDYSVTPRVATGGESVRVRVTARDDSALREAARFTIGAGSFFYSGYLRLLRAEKVYEGTVNLPDSAKGPLRLTAVTLHDYLGNFKEYTPR